MHARLFTPRSSVGLVICVIGLCPRAYAAANRLGMHPKAIVISSIFTLISATSVLHDLYILVLTEKNGERGSVAYYVRLPITLLARA